MTLHQALTGISGILVTPFDEHGDIAPERLVPIIDRALAAGLHVPVVNGNTGEFYALTTEEASTMVQKIPAGSTRPFSRREQAWALAGNDKRAHRIRPCPASHPIRLSGWE